MNTNQANSVQQSAEGDGMAIVSTQEKYSSEAKGCNVFLQKAKVLRHILEADLLACDAMWTLFVTAAHSYRYELKLNPFPSRFVSEHIGLDIDGLVDIIHNTPKLEFLLDHIKSRRFTEVDPDVLDLVHWVLVDRKEHGLRLVQEQDVYNWFRTTNLRARKQPSHIFVVCNTNEQAKNRFEDLGFPMELAFYGNKLDCFYSIINNGLTLHEPIVLTRNLVSSMERSPVGAAWGASSCGSLISCVALCEYVNDPDQVESKHMFRNDGESTYEAIQVDKASLVNVRYLLFYGTNSNHEVIEDNSLSGWVSRHKNALTMTAYLLVLGSIGFANRNNGRWFKEYISTKFQFLLNLTRQSLFAN